MKDFYDSNAENPDLENHQPDASDAKSQENNHAQSAALFEVTDSKQNNAFPLLGKKAARRSAELLESFVVDFLYEDNQLFSAFSLMEIANDLVGAPTLLSLCPTYHFIMLMQDFLIDQRRKIIPAEHLFCKKSKFMAREYKVLVDSTAQMLDHLSGDAARAS